MSLPGDAVGGRTTKYLGGDEEKGGRKTITTGLPTSLVARPAERMERNLFVLFRCVCRGRLREYFASLFYHANFGWDLPPAKQCISANVMGFHKHTPTFIYRLFSPAATYLSLSSTIALCPLSSSFSSPSNIARSQYLSHHFSPS